MDKEDLIKKWLNGDLNEAEKKAFDTLDDAELNNYIVNTAKRFKADQFIKAEDFTDFKTHYNTKKPLSKRWYSGHYLLKLASILVISFGIYITFFSNASEKTITLANQKLTVELPDHSLVELNALSEIEYDANNWSKIRTLKLQGEAFFKVSKGGAFNVFTKDGMVSVVGTKFNVKQREHYFEVKCYEGIVKVQSDTIIRQLYAGDIFKIFNGAFSEQRTSNIKPSWVDGMSTFEAMPFKEVLAELERQYQVEVTVKNVDINRLFTGAFKHDNLDNALISITQPMNMTYELHASNLVVIHGKNN